MEPLRLDNSTARRLFLHRHLLLDPPVGNPGRGALLDIIRHLGFVQLDSVNTMARAHDLILFSRQQSYRPGDLRRLIDRDRSLFEHWTHDAAALPMEFYPQWRLKFARDRDWIESRRTGGPAPDPKRDALHAEILARIGAGGTVMSRDLGGERPRSKGGWWDWHPSKTALEYLWRSGALAVCHRKGFQKAYDLSERVIPPVHRAARLGADAVIDWACEGALDRLGVATSGEIAAFWDLASAAEARDWCAARPDLIPVEQTCADGAVRKGFALPGIEERIRDLPDPGDRLRILSPFDPALRDRKRAERLFGFHYRIEIFVPEDQRQYGYYVFPILQADRLVGRIDVSCDRVAERLVVRALWPEPAVRWGKGRQARLDAELARLARFTGMADVTYEAGWLRA